MFDWGIMHWWPAMFLSLLFWILIIAVIVWAVKYITGHSRSTPAGRRYDDSALRILRERYARGEIDREEFESKRRDLGG